MALSGSEWAQEQIGRVLGQRWTLVGLLALGGSAAVFEASHRNGKRVAVKVLFPEHAADEARRRRFLREGYAANRVNHPRAVSVDDDHLEPDGTAFLVMELLEGEPLDRLVRRSGGKLPWPKVAEILHDLLEVLDAAHAQGVIHRDLKPANLFLQKGKGLRVLDFGLARQEGDPHPTHEGALLGTPAFMAPEQARGAVKAVGPWTDLWAVGAIGFSLLTGRRVHEGSSFEEQVMLAGAAQAPDLRRLAPDAPTPVVAVLQRALSYDPDERFPSVRTFRDALASAVGAPPAPVPEAEKSDSERTVEELPTASTRSVSRGQAPRSLLRPLGLLAAAVVALLVFALLRAGVPTRAPGGGASAEAVPAHSPRATSAPPIEASSVSSAPAPAQGVPAETSTRAAPVPSARRPERNAPTAGPPSAGAKPLLRAGGSEMVEDPPF